MKKTKDEKYTAEMDCVRRQIKELERSGVRSIPIEVAAAIMPVLPEYK